MILHAEGSTQAAKLDDFAKNGIRLQLLIYGDSPKNGQIQPLDSLHMARDP